jgi:hypothetical protein
MRDYEDWLERFHQGQRGISGEIAFIRGIARDLGYTFPHIANDLRSIAQTLESSNEQISQAINDSMQERLDDHNKFVGNALSACLGIK